MCFDQPQDRCAAACLSPSKPARPTSAKSVSILSASVCSDNLILLGQFHTEIIRYSISKLFPMFRQRFIKKLANCVLEFFEGGVMFIMGNPLVHDTPKALNGIEVGRVGRQEVDFHPALRTFKPWLKLLGMVVTRIVEYDVNCQCLGFFSLPFS